MDPLSQAALGASLSQSLAGRKSSQLSALIIGALAGMAPDLDILIRSSTDPLLSISYHRHFTHSLVFIPLGALICSLVIYAFMSVSWFKNRWPDAHLSFLQVYFFAFLGYLTHGFLDANTSYGTLLLWPFSDARIAWNTISIIDPLFTLPLVGLLIFSVVRKKRIFARVGLVYVSISLFMGLAQNQRAEQALLELAQQRGHKAERIHVKPSFGSRHLWKILYEHDGRYYVDAVKLLTDKQYFEGESIEKLDLKRDLASLRLDSQYAKDIERFRWFSDDFLAIHPNNSEQVIDVRYSVLPNNINPLWGIQLNKEKLNNGDMTSYVDFVVSRETSEKTRQMYFDMLFE